VSIGLAKASSSGTHSSGAGQQNVIFTSYMNSAAATLRVVETAAVAIYGEGTSFDADEITD